jgi:hypothetical protein
LNKRILTGFWGVLVALTLATAGCRSRQENVPAMESNLRPLALFYGQFVGQHSGKPPANEEEFRTYLDSLSAGELDAWGVDDVDRLFVSPRDGKPYVVLYGENALQGPRWIADSPVIAYEQVGVAGRRLVATALGAVEEVDEAELKDLLPGGS